MAIPNEQRSNKNEEHRVGSWSFCRWSGWEGVYKILKKDGYNVSIVQNPTVSLEDDVAATKRVLADQDAPAILVGHSYGGAVITEAGNDLKVAGLVYISAFAPDKGESVGSLIKNPAPGAAVPPILPPKDGYLLIDKAKFPAAFAADVDADKAAFMANSQVPFGVEALNGAISVPAWKFRQSWYLVTTDDQMIPPPAQRAMAKRAGAVVVEAKGSHAAYMSQPKAVAAIIEQAAKGVKTPGSRTDQLKQLISHIEKRETSKANMLLADDFMFSGPTPEPLSKKSFMEFHSSLVSAFPDFSFNAHDFEESGDKVKFKVSITGTNQRELNFPMMGIKAPPPISA